MVYYTLKPIVRNCGKAKKSKRYISSIFKLFYLKYYLDFEKSLLNFKHSLVLEISEIGTWKVKNDVKKIISMILKITSGTFR